MSGHSTTPVRGTLPKDRTAFLPYIDEPAKVKAASPTTIANWIKYHMKNAGIDTSVYKSYSLRSASSTKAVQNGHSTKVSNNIRTGA